MSGSRTFIGAALLNKKTPRWSGSLIRNASKLNTKGVLNVGQAPWQLSETGSKLAGRTAARSV